MVINGKYIIIAKGVDGIAEYYALVRYLLDLDDNGQDANTKAEKAK